MKGRWLRRFTGHQPNPNEPDDPIPPLPSDAPAVPLWEGLPCPVKSAFIGFKDRPWGHEAASCDPDERGFWNRRLGLRQPRLPPRPDGGVSRHPSVGDVRSEGGQACKMLSHCLAQRKPQCTSSQINTYSSFLHSRSLSALPNVGPLLTPSSPHISVFSPSPSWASQPLSHGQLAEKANTVGPHPPPGSCS